MATHYGYHWAWDDDPAQARPVVLIETIDTDIYPHKCFDPETSEKLEFQNIEFRQEHTTQD